MRGSSLILKTGPDTSLRSASSARICSALATMVRNLYMSNVRPRRVLRRWTKIAGPGEDARTAIQMPSSRGEKSASARPDSAMSSARLNMSAQEDLAVVLNRSMGSPASSSRETSASWVRRNWGSSQASMPSVSHCRIHSPTWDVEMPSGIINTASTTVACRMAEKSSRVPGAAKPAGGGTPAGGRKPTISKKRARSGWHSQSRRASTRSGSPTSRRRRRDSSRSSHGCR